ncbi:MAG: nucleoside monophosphate kinase, partial [Rickettsiales bacterium]|nr:nucleoside monophosphate kinase [Rickettsiales bacterium]
RVSGRFSCGDCKTGYHDETKQPKVENTCDNCGGHNFTRRKDDNPETMKSRLATYHEQTEPVLPYYEEKAVLKTLDGMAGIDEVTAEIDAIVAGKHTKRAVGDKSTAALGSGIV